MAYYRINKTESEIVSLVAKGFSNEDIADIMGNKIQTVKNVVHLVMKKTGIKTRVELATEFIKSPEKFKEGATGGV